jgi:hypothetical protein
MHRNATGAMTDTMPAPNTTGFSTPTANYYGSIGNFTALYTDVITTTGTFACPIWCNSTTLTLLPGYTATFYSPDTTSTWQVEVKSYPRTFGMLADPHGNGLTAGLGSTTLFTNTSGVTATYRITPFMNCTGSGSVTMTVTWTDAATSLGGSAPYGGSCVSTLNAAQAPFTVNIASGASVTYAIVRTSAGTYNYSLLAEGPF